MYVELTKNHIPTPDIVVIIQVPDMILVKLIIIYVVIIQLPDTILVIKLIIYVHVST